MAKKEINLTQKKIGLLTVIRKIEDTDSTNKPTWLCQCECGNDILMKQNLLLTPTKTPRSCGCLKQKNKQNMTEQDKKDWDALYQYVKKNIMNYDETQSLSKDMVLRLKGLLNNKYMANNSVENTANYSYEVILNTFKFCSKDIQKALSVTTFKDERHKVNYIMKIIEKNINTVYIRMRESKAVKEKTENMTIDTANHVGATYQRKTTNYKEKFEKYW